MSDPASASPRSSLPVTACAGGHSVITGLLDYLQRWHPGSRLLGVLTGPRGVVQNDARELKAEDLVSGRRGGGGGG